MHPPLEELNVSICPTELETWKFEGMDPASIVGLVLSLSGFCAKAVSGINSLKDKWVGSNLSLASLATECATLGATLSVLLNMLQTSLQRKTLVEMEKMMRKHQRQARLVYAASKKS
ncbi:hypothetical protein B0T26DRAFT_681740 [Lasiosphaeria miniovina]|uniref:Uncharacterized protein n=1 Tax=Lasiosphaeria miniovina TaxID=1954250 RepID=A0AA39ZQ29_9PEZI|nr:uncharacterized protein B0T26DRAFT_681740 [Lasiosphaeria miniovina]KAK0701609.1 hypothetical protein B0T26DRAFT_681740 [Lasiosphaeria miniovina]